MDIHSLKALLTLLNASGVSHYKDKEVEIGFYRPGATQKAVEPVKEMAPHLSADDAMKYDEILFHSASPAHDDKTLPLTGDVPMNESAL